MDLKWNVDWSQVAQERREVVGLLKLWVLCNAVDCFTIIGFSKWRTLLHGVRPSLKIKYTEVSTNNK
jgi:hypothetical protein